MEVTNYFTLGVNLRPLHRKEYMHGTVNLNPVKTPWLESHKLEEGPCHLGLDKFTWHKM